MGVITIEDWFEPLSTLLRELQK